MPILDPAIDGSFSSPPARGEHSGGLAVFNAPLVPIDDLDSAHVDYSSDSDIHVEIHNSRTMGLIVRMQSAVVESVKWELNGVGECVFTWSPHPSEEIGAEFLIADGRPLTWRDAPLEAWVFRKGVCVWRGPIVHQTHMPDIGRVRAVAWSREGYIQRLINGLAPPLEWLPQGNFAHDPALASWVVSGAFSPTTVTSPLYRNDRSMFLPAGFSPAGSVRAWTTFDASPNTNVVYVLVVARFEGNAWTSTSLPGDARVIGEIQHDLLLGETIVRTTTETIQLQQEADVGGWYRINTAFQQVANYRNRYTIRIYAPGANDAWIGEVSVIRGQNLSARAGWDYSRFPAAIAGRCVDYLGEPWDFSIDDLGRTLGSSMRAMNTDHADMRSLFGDTETYGDWWVDATSVSHPVIRWTQKRGRFVPELTNTSESTAGATVAFDGAAEHVATHIILLSNGQDGPTREEAHARYNPPPGAVLARCEIAGRGIAPRDLMDAASELLENDSGIRPTFVGQPKLGPGETSTITGPYRDLQGAWIHRISPGDWTWFRQRDGLLDYVVEARIATMTWTPLNDMLVIQWFAPATPDDSDTEIY